MYVQSRLAVGTEMINKVSPDDLRGPPGHRVVETHFVCACRSRDDCELPFLLIQCIVLGGEKHFREERKDRCRE